MVRRANVTTRSGEQVLQVVGEEVYEIAESRLKKTNFSGFQTFVFVTRTTGSHSVGSHQRALKGKCCGMEVYTNEIYETRAFVPVK